MMFPKVPGSCFLPAPWSLSLFCLGLRHQTELDVLSLNYTAYFHFTGFGDKR